MEERRGSGKEGGQIFIVDKTVSNRLTDIQQRSYTYNNGNELLNYGAGGVGVV